MFALIREKIETRDVLLCLLGSLLLAFSSQLSIPLWFTPIPLVVQNTLALSMGLLLGKKRGAAAVFAFLMQGALGLPVFAGGAAGFAVLMGPRAGYLVGYLVGAYLVGYLMEKTKSSLLAMIAGGLAIYACGASWLALFVGVDKAFMLGVAPFVLGDALKTAACVSLLTLKKD
jgi:biotin transport system substrate-specific component